MKKKPLAHEPLVPKVTEHLLALNAAGFQRIPADAIGALAVNQAKTLAFLGTTVRDLDIRPEEYQGLMDFSLSTVQNLDDGEKLNFLNAVGHPLSPDELLRYFFGR